MPKYSESNSKSPESRFWARLRKQLSGSLFRLEAKDKGWPDVSWVLPCGVCQYWLELKAKRPDQYPFAVTAEQALFARQRPKITFLLVSDPRRRSGHPVTLFSGSDMAKIRQVKVSGQPLEDFQLWQRSLCRCGRGEKE